MTNPGRNPLLLVLLVGLSSTGTLSLRAAADDSMEWQFSETNDPSNQGRKTARLVYGVPETDNIQVLGVCDASQSTPSASVTFGADIGNLETGKDTDLRFSGGGFDYALKGQISRPTSEEGLTGVHADVAQDDPLWSAFAEKDSLDYLVPGYKASTIDLTRGKDKIASFLQACKSYAAAATGSQAGSSASASNSDKEDFESAKELGTAEAWQAFLAAPLLGFLLRSCPRLSGQACDRRHAANRGFFIRGFVIRRHLSIRPAPTCRSSARRALMCQPSSRSSTNQGSIAS